MNQKEKEMQAGNLEMELMEIEKIELVQENILLSVTVGMTGFLTLVCC